MKQAAGAAGALRARQGQGARYDAPEAPGEALLLARRGTAYFARLLNGITDAGLDAPSLRPGVGRRALIAKVGYDARDLAQRLEALAKGTSFTPHPDPTSRIALGACLPARALRHLFQHTEVHLNVAWRDLPGPMWQDMLPGASGKRDSLLAEQSPLHRARLIWHAALDLDAGGALRDLPETLRETSASEP